MTTKDVIKLLPIKEELKVQILKMYDYMEPAQKLTIERIAWNHYDLLHDESIQENIEKQLADEEGAVDLGPDFYNQVANATNQELNKEMHNSSGAVDLAAARQAMKQIARELQDAKHAKHVKHAQKTAKAK